MNISRQLRRKLRPAAKSLGSIIRWRRLRFDEAPPIFGNSKPKSGSHLLLQVLAGMTRAMPYRYVGADPVRTIARNGARRSPDEILRELRATPTGVIGWGYVEPTPENMEFLCRPDRVNYFLYRDPRDVLVSHVYFATDMYEEHGMHGLYRSLPDFGARLKIAITGIDGEGLKLASVRQRYQAVLDWLHVPGVLCIRFEDFLDRREAVLNSMLDQVEKTGYRIRAPRARCVSLLAAAIQPTQSRTFRSGTSGGWREHFTPEHKRLFHEVAGDLLVQLGYEKDGSW